MTDENGSVTSSDYTTDDDVGQYLCPICLQQIVEPAYIDPCYHQYCYSCILQWLEHSIRCPLCNRNAAAIIQQQPSGRVVKTPVSLTLTEPNWPIQRHTYGRNQILSQTEDALGMRKREAVYTHMLRRVSSSTTSLWRRTRISQSPILLRAEIESPRCRRWICRDLQAALGIDNVTIIESLVIALVKDKGSLDLVASSESEPNSLMRLLGSKTRLFLNELAAFVDSSLDMHSYDIYIAYDTRQTE